MAHLIDKDALVAEIERRIASLESFGSEAILHDNYPVQYATLVTLKSLKFSIDTLEVKEVDEQKERMSECPYRKVGCTMYEGKILECRGACCWVVDYQKSKELKAQKGEEV